jgi:pyrrolysine biosynthesis protein PylD
MTRLTERDLDGLAGRLVEYDRELMGKTGLTLTGLAVRAAGLSEAEALERVRTCKVGVIPMTCGQGVIPGFASLVRGISAHLGFESFVTSAADAGGLAEAVRRRAEIVIAADEHCFTAINLTTRVVADNDEATGAGFATALDRMAGGLEGRPALVIGLGPVGKNAAGFLIRLGALVSVYDLDRQKALEWASGAASLSVHAIKVVDRLEAALREISYILDATPAADLIDDSVFSERTRVAAPGVPCGIAAAAREKHRDGIVHDPLQIGTATMLMMALLDPNFKK